MRKMDRTSFVALPSPSRRRAGAVGAELVAMGIPRSSGDCPVVRGRRIGECGCAKITECCQAHTGPRPPAVGADRRPWNTIDGRMRQAVGCREGVPGSLVGGMIHCADWRFTMRA